MACGAKFLGSIPDIHLKNIKNLANKYKIICFLCSALTPSSSGRIAFFHDAYTGSIPVGVNFSANAKNKI